MIVIGVTGSIGSGKSYFCRKFTAKRGVRYLSSDAMVHEIYEHDKNTLAFFNNNIPNAIEDGKINRQKLGKILFEEPKLKSLLESFIYPKLREIREIKLVKFKQMGIKIAAIEIPLLFENNLEDDFDFVITIFCNKIIQKQRVMRRNNMSLTKFKKIAANQMLLSEKLKITDIAINSGESIASDINKIYLKLLS